MKTRRQLQLWLLAAMALAGIGAAGYYTIDDLTNNAAPGAGTIIEVYDPTATPQSGKLTLNSTAFRTAAGVTAAFIQANQTNVAAANPTATVATTAVNGSATTFMRSDAAPAIPAAFITANQTNVAAANPTATVATTAVNGSATTFMRSDAAPAIPASFITANQTNATLASLGGAPLANPSFTGTINGENLELSGTIGADALYLPNLLPGFWYLDSNTNAANVDATAQAAFDQLATNTWTGTGTAVLSSVTDALASKTFDPTVAGYTLNQTKYMLLMRPDWGDGVGAIPHTNSYVASGLMHYTFSGDAETNANYVVYETAVPPDIDTSVDMTATFAFVAAGDDTDTVTFHIAYGLGVVDAAYPVALANIATSPLAFAAVTPPASATGKHLTTAALTLTGWAGSMTAGTPLLISVRRLQDSNDAGQRDLYLRLSYGSTQ